TSVAGATVCLNEVLYDPTGSDSGYEFVELYNTSASAVDLAGWRIEAGNGSGPGEWDVQWEGAAGDRIGPRGFFVVAGPLMQGPADARAPLTLQNGPDAVRLMSPARCEDRVGWGALEFEEYYESGPAQDVPGGWVLARIPDGTDSDRNTDDFQGRARPSPGEANAKEWMLALAQPHCDPPLLDSGGKMRMFVQLSNLGLSPVDLDSVSWIFEAESLSARLADPPARVLAPAEVFDLVWEIVPASGLDSPEGGTSRYRLGFRDPDGNETAVAGRVRIGRGPVLISEVLYDSGADEGEWIELWNASPQPVSASGWQVQDGSGRKTVLQEPSELASGGFLIVAESPAGLLRAHPDLPASLIASRQGAWPSLNNAIDRDLGYADEITLLDARGLAVDYVRYAPGDLDGRGVSLERWIEGERLVDPQALIPCPDAAGATPGRSSWPAGDSGSGAPYLRPDPNPFLPAEADAERFCLIRVPPVPGGDAEITADIFTLAGTRVATLTAGARASGPVVLAWNGRSSGGDALPSGLYLVRMVLRARDAASSERRLVPVALFRRSLERGS
ncbi:MAG: lamin tail domain-containing protein, partial [Candidatus Eisenbacteria bacterium]